MNNNKKIITILIVLVSVLILALAGAIIYILISQNDNLNNKGEIVVNNNNSNGLNNNEEGGVNKAEELAIRTFNAQFTMYEGDKKTAAQIRLLISTITASNSANSQHQVTLNEEGKTTVEEIEDEKIYTVTLLYDYNEYVSEVTITESTVPGNEEQQPAGDMEKLLFNSVFTPYLGEITGEQLNALLRSGQESNNRNPEHQVKLTSNNLTGEDLTSINPIDKFIITLSYDDAGYVNKINIDKKV